MGRHGQRGVQSERKRRASPCKQRAQQNLILITLLCSAGYWLGLTAGPGPIVWEWGMTALVNAGYHRKSGGLQTIFMRARARGVCGGNLRLRSSSRQSFPEVRVAVGDRVTK